MEKNLESNEISFEKLYADPTFADGTVRFSDYFYHSVYLRYALHENLIVFNQIKKQPLDIRVNNSKLGIFFTLIILTNQIIENLIKARSLYDLYKLNKLTKYPTLRTVVNKYWKCQGHEIEKIIKVSGLKINQDEIDLLEKIKPFFMWGGRYPQPFKREDYLKKERENLRESFSSSWIRIIDGLFKRFAEEMEISHHLELPSK